ncbi:MAG: hypothetical protein CR977_01405 [Gammaproteobacteria bacterium]|nr:MAG: hypothetical protein CR977_01405 [Gammaproteobacteria bacterium]
MVHFSMISVVPDRLSFGDTIGIVSPADAVTPELHGYFNRGVDYLEQLSFTVKLGKNALSNTLNYSATAQEKADDLHAMFADPDVKAIICSQGGANTNTLLPLLDFSLIKKHPKILLGLSDISVLLNTIYQQTGLVTFYGNTLIWGFGRNPTAYDKQEFIARLVDGATGSIAHNSEWQCVRGGVAEGILIGGNLNCLNKLAGTPYQTDFTDKILLLETYGEYHTPASVEGELSRLKQMGVFEQIKGLWLGYYQHESRITYAEIVMNTVKDYHFPIIQCDDFGHKTPTTVIPIGARVRLDASNQQVVILPTAKSLSDNQNH